MTKIVNLFGGAGAGKSSLAAEIYFKMKVDQLSCELVREYVKEWVWTDREIGPFDQFYIIGKQIKKESLLYGKVDFVITDSPLLCGAYYSEHFNRVSYVTEYACNFMKYSESLGMKYCNYFLDRGSIPFEERGRYQNKEEAIEIDKNMLEFLTRLNIPFTVLTENGEYPALNKIIEQRQFWSDVIIENVRSS